MARPKAFDEEAVLEKAIDIFWSRGYEATSVQDLVDGLGINRASMYDTYGDKYQLYRKALDRYRQVNQNGLCSLADQSRPTLELIRDLLESGARESLNDPDHKGCFMVNSAIELASHDPDVARVVAENQRVFEGVLQRIIERGQQEGDITKAHSAANLAKFLFNTINGLKVLGKTTADAASLESVITVAMSTLTAK